MRDAKLSFVYTNTAVTASATLLGYTPGSNTVSIAGTTYSIGGTITQAGASANATLASALELNYGGLLINGVTGNAMDNDYSGSVDVNDYVRGQILTPLYVTAPVTINQLTFGDSFTLEVHSSNTTGFTPSATTVTASSVWTATPAFTVAATVVSAVGGTLSAATAYFITAIVGNVITLSTGRGGSAVGNITSVTVANANNLAVNQVVTLNVAVLASSTTAVVLSVYPDTTGAIISVPLQSYNRFLRVRWLANTIRSGASIQFGRTAIQTGREGSF